MSTPISATGSTATTATTGTSTSATSNATVPSASSIISSAALGIGTTVPISQVLTGLMQVESIPLTQLQNQVTGVNTEISAYGQLNSALSTFQQSLAALTRPTEFNSYTATSSNTAAVTASAVIGVQAGTYTVNTTQLAQAQSLATAGQASLNTSLTSGSATSTVTIAFGTQNGSTFTQNAAQPGGSITINSSNNTLAGLRDAINSANLGVTATIVNDGSNTPYHLVLTSNQTGANESMQVSVQGDSSLASMLTYPPGTGDTMTQTVKAQDANLTVNGLSLTSSSNSVGTAVPGLTLNLQQTGTSTVSVAANTSSVQTDIDNFVSAYNTLHSTIGQLTAYNPGGTNGPLIGDATTMQIQNQLQTVLASGLTGTGSGYSSLAAVGIGLDSDGTLSVDDTALSQALQSNPEPVLRAVRHGRCGDEQQCHVPGRRHQHAAGLVRRQHHATRDERDVRRLVDADLRHGDRLDCVERLDHDRIRNQHDGDDQRHATDRQFDATHQRHSSRRCGATAIGFQ
jgi:flagellar hook-associated protein 2